MICLVVSAVSAGYLWRAALEGDAELGRLLDTSPPATIQPGASPPAFAGRIHAGPSPDRALAAERRGVARADPARTKPARSKPISRRQKRAKAVLVVERPAATTPKRSPAPSTGATAPKKQPKRPKAAPGAAGKTSIPKSPRGPRQQPPGGKSDPTGGSAAPPQETPASRPPENAPADPPAPVEPPVLVPTPEPEAKPPTTQAVRPGWGHGDEKHVHSGPPGKKKK